MPSIKTAIKVIRSKSLRYILFRSKYEFERRTGMLVGKYPTEQKPVNIKETQEYLDLQKEFDGYKTKQTARTSAEFSEVKPKFFDRVYDLLDHADGAKPVTEQLAALKKDYEEYFTPQNPAPSKPQFGAKPEGSMPTGEEGAVAAMAKAWGLPTK